MIYYFEKIQINKSLLNINTLFYYNFKMNIGIKLKYSNYKHKIPLFQDM